MLRVLGFAAVIISVLRVWPQAIRLIRTDDSALGVSVVTWSLAAACQPAWIIYGIGAHVMASTVSNSLVGISCVVVLVNLIRLRSDALSTIIRVVSPILLTELFVLTFFGYKQLGNLGVVLSISIFIPQAFRAFQVSCEGISRLTFLALATSTSIWGAYGVLIHKPVVSYPTVVILPVSLMILFKTSKKTENFVPEELALTNQ